MTQDLDRSRDRSRDRRTAGGLLGGAAACVVLAAGTGSTAPVWLTAGMLAGALMVYRRTVSPRPYAYWPAWATGAVLALLLAWAGPGPFRVLLLPWAGVEAAVALVLALLWYRRRNGRGDWVVWHVEERLLLRREWSMRDAIRWAELYGKPCEISPLDEFPELADEVPLYPDRERPLREVRPVTEQD
ncbi:hypothetical protein OG762_51640 (plasmid) [Streptomyces sp. NBC_01136]|uniref:hypothetical protein n=1 Tax=Streptomyces sp. NBC_01136 TaxID=2903754 RepID=UPI002F9126D8|nr:hypothetical protein OG762_51640 [Streptomyces sp. NBC_01136]